jgi:hypothetical protein
MKRLIPGLFQIGAILVLIGAVVYITQWPAARYIYLIGGAIVAISQILSPIHTENKVVKRLHIQQIVGGLFLFISGICMFVLHGNEWIICLTISCVFELYSVYRISYEMKKEN